MPRRTLLLAATGHRWPSLVEVVYQELTEQR
jgi:hypothetical protein